ERAGDQPVFRDGAVGKERVVRSIDIACVGPRTCDLAVDGEPPEARVEHENGRVCERARGHRGSDKSLLIAPRGSSWGCARHQLGPGNKGRWAYSGFGPNATR